MSNEQAAPASATELKGMKLAELQALASTRGLKGTSKMRKSQLIDVLSQSSADSGPAADAPAAVEAPRTTRRRAVSASGFFPRYILNFL